MRCSGHVLLSPSPGGGVVAKEAGGEYWGSGGWLGGGWLGGGWLGGGWLGGGWFGGR